MKIQFIPLSLDGRGQGEGEDLILPLTLILSRKGRGNF
jgi:hypothetical protein